MASWFNPNSNSMQGGVSAANVGGGKSFDSLAGMGQAMGGGNSAAPGASLSQKLSTPTDSMSYQPSQRSSAPDMGSVLNGSLAAGNLNSMNFASAPSAPSQQQSKGGK